MNIKATQIINPSKIKRVKDGNGKPPLRTRNSFTSQTTEQSDSDFSDVISGAINKTHLNDWKARSDAVDTLFKLISSNPNKFQQNTKSNKLNEAADTICKLLADQNAKIQLSTLDKFNHSLPLMQPFIESHLTQFYSTF